MNHSEYFLKEINCIKNEKIKNSLIYMIEKLPDYFFLVAASSTGKYHPKYAQGEGGLLRHSKAAFRIGYELLSNPIIGDKYTSDEKDLMLMGLLIHDGLKLGREESKYTKFEHPILMANYIDEQKDHLELSDEQRKLVCEVIKTHMGPWTTDYQGKEVLEKPKTKYQSFVHMCDYLASKKCIEMQFDDDDNIIL
ncbi:MAG: HD domain-containing protein [Bacilli bacterium]|nr:HD domain-containing protein [Bacilli bacterium]